MQRILITELNRKLCHLFLGTETGIKQLGLLHASLKCLT